MSVSTNTCSVPTTPIETISILTPTPPITPYLTIYELYDTIKYIHTEIKAFNENIHTDIKSIDYHIAYILATIIYTRVRTNKQDMKITYLSSKLSTYEDCLEKTSNKETQLDPFAYDQNIEKQQSELI